MTTFVNSWMTLNKEEKDTMCLSPLYEMAFMRWQTAETLQIPPELQMGKTFGHKSSGRCSVHYCFSESLVSLWMFILAKAQKKESETK